MKKETQYNYPSRLGKRLPFSEAARAVANGISYLFGLGFKIETNYMDEGKIVFPDGSRVSDEDVDRLYRKDSIPLWLTQNPDLSRNKEADCPSVTELWIKIAQENGRYRRGFLEFPWWWDDRTYTLRTFMERSGEYRAQFDVVDPSIRAFLSGKVIPNSVYSFYPRKFIARCTLALDKKGVISQVDINSFDRIMGGLEVAMQKPELLFTNGSRDASPKVILLHPEDSPINEI